MVHLQKLRLNYMKNDNNEDNYENYIIIYTKMALSYTTLYANAL